MHIVQSKGFLVKQDYQSVVSNMRLASGHVWSIPITLPISVEQARTISIGDEVSLDFDRYNIWGDYRF